MNYSGAVYQQMEERKGKKIPKKVSDYDAETRYISRKGHREAYEQLTEEIEEEAEQDISKGFRKIGVSKFTPGNILSAKMRIHTADNKGERYEKRKKHREDELKAEIEAEQVQDKKTIAKVSKALRTRSQELRDIEQDAYDQQAAKEKGKRTAKENARAQRKGQQRGMGAFDRTVETAANATQVIIDTKEKLQGAKNKILHTTGEKPAKKQPSQPILTAAQKKVLAAQLQRAAGNIKPKKYTPPFAVEHKKLPVERKTLPVNKPSGNPFATSRKGNLLGARRSGNPLVVQKRKWSL